MRHVIKTISSQNVPLVMLNNFTPHKYFVKIAFSCSKRRLIGQAKSSKMTSTNGVIDQKQNMVSKNIFPDCLSDRFEQLCSLHIFRKDQVELFEKAMMK